jgi:hypothetical protein
VSGSGPGKPERRELLHLAGACLVLLLGVWANTGTLPPYAASLNRPMVLEPCNYLLNIDHNHFKATFLLLDGAPRDQWEYSVVLRRLLYPVTAYPFMKALGFIGGGIAANVALAAGALVLFWRGLRRRYGDVPPAVLWLLATYPGIFYWAGLPYSYAVIVPSSLLGLMILWRLEALAGWREALLWGLALGVLFTGYDLMPFFGGAGLLLLLSRRLWGPGAVLAVAMLVPQTLLAVLLRVFLEVPLRNANTQAYGFIVGSYLSLGEITGEGLRTWGRLLQKLPEVTLDNYLYSNFLFLPLLFLLGLAVARWLPRDSGRAVPRAEACLLAAALLVFLFNNLAPPYPGWQLRGSWLARLYQPIVAALVSVLAGVLAREALLPRGHRRLLWGGTAAAIAAQAWIVFAPVLGFTALSQFVYFRFYRHAPETSYSEMLARYGARPAGFCASSPAAPASVRP